MVIGNAVHSSNIIGIDLGADRVTLNDVHDFDTGPNTADLLLPLILLGPATAKAYVTLALSSNPALLFATAEDQSLQHQAMLLATDPRYTTSDEAGAIIITLLRGFAAEDDTVDVGLYGFDPDWHPFLAALVALAGALSCSHLPARERKSPAPPAVVQALALAKKENWREAREKFNEALAAVESQANGFTNFHITHA